MGGRTILKINCVITVSLFLGMISFFPNPFSHGRAESR